MITGLIHRWIGPRETIHTFERIGRRAASALTTAAISSHSGKDTQRRRRSAKDVLPKNICAKTLGRGSCTFDCGARDFHRKIKRSEGERKQRSLGFALPPATGGGAGYSQCRCLSQGPRKPVRGPHRAHRGGHDLRRLTSLCRRDAETGRGRSSGGRAPRSGGGGRGSVGQWRGRQRAPARVRRAMEGQGAHPG